MTIFGAIIRTFAGPKFLPVSGRQPEKSQEWSNLMFKQALSALVVSSMMASGAAFAADPVAAAPQAQTTLTKTNEAAAATTTSLSQAQTALTKTNEAATTTTTSVKASAEKKHQKVVHKQDQVKASVVKSDMTKISP